MERIFEEDCDDNAITSIVRGQDSEFTSGRRPINDKECQQKGLSLRDELRLKLLDHDMHRPTQNDWHEDNHMHIVRG